MQGTASRILKDAGVAEAPLRQAIGELRGGRKAETPSSEDTYQSLSKYARNLVEEARAGKLDPVIGRDEEIRRTPHTMRHHTRHNTIQQLS